MRSTTDSSGRKYPIGHCRSKHQAPARTASLSIRSSSPSRSRRGIEQSVADGARLEPVQALVEALPGEQLSVRPALANLPVVQHENFVGADNCTQSVGDGDRRASGHQRRERRLNLRLDLAVHGARRLVEDEQRRIRRDGASERQQLALTDADRRAPLTERLLIAARQTPNDAVRADARRRGRDLELRNLVREADVREHVSGEEEDVLLHVADQRAQLGQRDLANVDAVHQDSPALRVVEAQQQVDDRRLARAGVPHERERPSRLDGKAHTLEHPLRRRDPVRIARDVAQIVREPHVVEFHAHAARAAPAVADRVASPAAREADRPQARRAAGTRARSRPSPAGAC